MKIYKNSKQLIPELIIGSNKQKNKIFEYLSNIHSLNCLDLGCSVPLNLFNCYHLFNCNKLVGVDSVNEEKCVNEFYKLNKEIKSVNYNNLQKCKNFYEVYKVIYKPEENEKPKLSSKDEFDDIFLKSFKFEKYKDYLENGTDFFDLIICSNLLHLESLDYKEILKKFKLIKNGLVLLRVQRKPNFDYKSFIKEFSFVFPNGEIHEVENGNGDWESSILINKQGLIYD